MNTLIISAAFIRCLALSLRSALTAERDPYDCDGASGRCLSNALAAAVLGEGDRVVNHLLGWVENDLISRGGGSADECHPAVSRLRDLACRVFVSECRMAASHREGFELGYSAARDLIPAMAECEEALNALPRCGTASDLNEPTAATAIEDIKALDNDPALSLREWMATPEGQNAVKSHASLL